MAKLPIRYRGKSMTTKVIHHEEAMKNLTAERYLLGELSEDDRDAYEEHFFSCPICFEQIKAGTEFVGHLRRIGTQDPAPALAPGFMSKILGNVSQMAAMGAFALLICVSGVSIYQQSVIRGLRAPQVVSVVTLTSASRGTSKIVTSGRNGIAEVRVIFQPESQFKTYSAVINDAAGREMMRIPLNAPTNEELQVRFNTGAFRNGN